MWGLPELLSMLIVYARYALALAIFLALFSSPCCTHTEGWCECSWLSTPTVYVGSYAVALLIFLALFSSLGCTSRAVWAMRTRGLITLKQVKRIRITEWHSRCGSSIMKKCNTHILSIFAHSAIQHRQQADRQTDNKVQM